MSVYVDHFRAPLGRMKMCHLVADSREELLAMVDHIGVDRKWMQHDGKATEHFDIALCKRDAAIAHGARAVTTRELATITRRKRSLPSPETPSMDKCFGVNPRNGKRVGERHSWLQGWGRGRCRFCLKSLRELCDRHRRPSARTPFPSSPITT